MKDMQWYYNTVKGFETMSSVDQDLTIKVGLGTSLADIMASSDPLISELNKGFSVEVQLELIAQLKKIIFDLLKDSEVVESDLAPFLMGVSPLILLTLNGQVDLAFEDYDELKDLPLLEPFLANFNQLFEGATGQDLDTVLDESNRIDVSSIPDDAPKSLTQFKQAIDLIHAWLDLLAVAHEDGDLQVSAVWPKIAST